MNEKELPSVKMEQAFRWFCLSCGVENFDRAQEVEFDTPEEEQEMKDAMGVEDWEEGCIVEAPPTVTCRDCLMMFRTDDSACDCDE